MRRECSYILPNHHKCHSFAVRGKTRCFHHIDPAERPPARPPRDPYSRITRWRELGRNIHTLPVEEIPYNVFIILGGLIAEGPNGISDREAGRLLRILLRRTGAIPHLPPAGYRIFDTFDAPSNSPAPSAPPAPAAAAPVDAGWHATYLPRPGDSEDRLAPDVLDFLESQIQDPELMRRLRAM